MKRKNHKDDEIQFIEPPKFPDFSTLMDLDKLIQSMGVPARILEGKRPAGNLPDVKKDK